MTVKQMIAALSKLPNDVQVIIQKDGEGNGYSPLSDIDLGIYRPDSTWSGERIDPGDKECGDEPAVFLAPVN